MKRCPAVPPQLLLWSTFSPTRPAISTAPSPFFKDKQDLQAQADGSVTDHIAEWVAVGGRQKWIPMWKMGPVGATGLTYATKPPPGTVSPTGTGGRTKLYRFT